MPGGFYFPNAEGGDHTSPPSSFRFFWEPLPSPQWFGLDPDRTPLETYLHLSCLMVPYRACIPPKT